MRRLTFDAQPASVVTFWDLSRQKGLEEQLKHMALHDPLTGLPNRVLFFETLKTEIARAQRTASYRFAVLFIDLDEFKRVNDSLGHDAGDAVLVGVAERLRAGLRAGDAPARLGGDELVAVLSGVEAPEEAQLIADRLSAALREPHRVGDQEVVCPGTVGVVVCDGHQRDPGEVMREADAAMYRLKPRRGPRSSEPPGS